MSTSQAKKVNPYLQDPLIDETPPTNFTPEERANFKKTENTQHTEPESPRGRPSKPQGVLQSGSSKAVTITAICGVLFFGTSNTFIIKYQDEFGFKHPVFQSFLVLFGQYLNYITFVVPILGQKGRIKHFNEMIERNANSPVKKSVTLKIF